MVSVLHFVPDVDEPWAIVEPGLVDPRKWRSEDDEAAAEKFADIVGVAIKR